MAPALPHGVYGGPPPTLLANVNDHLPMANISSFGLCVSPANPAVVAATAAASGVFTPAPCVPATAAPWLPPAKVVVNGVPAFGQEATCQCTWQGTVAVVSPGQVGVVTGA